MSSNKITAIDLETGEETVLHTVKRIITGHKTLDLSQAGSTNAYVIDEDFADINPDKTFVQIYLTGNSYHALDVIFRKFMFDGFEVGVILKSYEAMADYEFNYVAFEYY